MTEAAQIVGEWKRQNDASNAALARAAGVPVNTVRNILLGKGVTATTLSKLRTVRGLAVLRAEHFTNGAGT